LFFRRRNEGNEGGVFFVSCFEVMGNKITDGGAGARQFGSCRQMDDQDIQLLIIGRSVGAEPLVTGYMVFEGVLDIATAPCLGFGCVDLVQQVDGKVLEAGLVKALGKSLANERVRLIAIHLAPKR